MAEPHVPFALKLPIDLDQEIRAAARRADKSIQSTIIAWLRFAHDASKNDTLEPKAPITGERS